MAPVHPSPIPPGDDGKKLNEISGIEWLIKILEERLKNLKNDLKDLKK